MVNNKDTADAAMEAYEAWVRENVPFTMTGLPSNDIFIAGYDAAMSQTCEWEFKWVDRFNEPIYGPACDIEWSYERSTFCPNCGGRVVVKEAK